MFRNTVILVVLLASGCGASVETAQEILRPVEAAWRVAAEGEQEAVVEGYLYASQTFLFEDEAAISRFDTMKGIVFSDERPNGLMLQTLQTSICNRERVIVIGRLRLLEGYRPAITEVRLVRHAATGETCFRDEHPVDYWGDGAS